VKPHRRQFIIGPAPVAVDDRWTSTAIGGGLYLSHQQALPVAVVRDRDGGAWYLLGIAVQADPARGTPVEAIATARSTEMGALTATWAGRWVLIGDGTVRTDAGGLMGCFYGRDPCEGKLLVSSSAALVRQQIGSGEPSLPLRYEVGMDWYPPPASRFAGVRRLLPSQTLALSDGHGPVRHRPLVNDHVSTPYEETLAYLETSLRTALRNLTADKPSVWLALTGGYDSRVLLAAMWREGLDFTTFTWEVPGMSSADRVIPPMLARDAGIPHRFVDRHRFDDERLRMLDEHTALHTVDLDRELYPSGQYDDFPAGAMVISTALFEVGALYYHDKLAARPDEAARSIEQAFGFAEHHAESAAHRDGLREWAEWIHAHPEPAIDWRDRFYWEQRGAGWAAAFLQGSDLVEVETVTPANCESVLAAMLRIDPARRRGKRWEVDLAYRMAPFVTDHPYGLGGPLVTRFRRGASGLVHHPSKRRFATGRIRSLTHRIRARPDALVEHARYGVSAPL
jgi:hypothetical protein